MTRVVSRTARALRVLACAALFGSLVPLPALSQDIEPGDPSAAPGVNADGETPGVLGEPQVIDVDVGPDADIASIVLYHRFAGETEFASVPMRTLDDAGLYTATVPTRGADAEALEFYVVAEEASGESLFKGSAFDPLTRELARATAEPPTPSDPVVAAPADIEIAEPGADRRKYLYYALGALAVGAVVAAASSGGGGGGGSDQACDDGVCGLTIALPEP